MKYMVCNCNSYGNIDYEKPLLFTSCDYRTSSKLASRYIPLGEQKFFGYRRPESRYEKDPLLACGAEQFKSIYAKTFQGDPEKYETKSRKALLLPKTHYLRTFKEKMFKNPARPLSFATPEYKDQYYRKQAVPSLEQNIESQAICKVSSLGKGEQPRIKIEETGIMKQLDPYVTTSQMAHYPFTKDQISTTKQSVLTFYNAKACPALTRIKIKKPLNDEVVFKIPSKDRFVPVPVHRVPYSGKTSIYQSSYVHPTRGCLYTEGYNHGVEFLVSYPNPSKSQTLVVPNMYCTDYCHIGTGKSVKTAIHDIKKTYKHDYCN